MKKIRAIQVVLSDNIATILGDAKNGMLVDVYDKNNELTNTIQLKSDINYGNKLALTDIQKGNPIIKYGSKIGISIKNICAGELVHVHNVDSFISVIPESVRKQVISEMGI